MSGEAFQILNALPHPVIVVDAAGRFRFANSDAEQFFSAGSAYLARKKLQDFVRERATCKRSSGRFSLLLAMFVG